MNMRILVYGAGVIGSIFAEKLAVAGNDVTILARGKRLGISPTPAIDSLKKKLYSEHS